jgi:anti-sigma factor RsiW
MNGSSTAECKEFVKSSSASLDGLLTSEQLMELDAHLNGCSVCARKHRSLQALRGSLLALPHRNAPTDLPTRLRVLASHEKVRRARISSFQSRCATWSADFRLFAHNLMRPFAIPAFGGFASAVVLFSMLSASPAFAVRAVSGRDVPTVLYTDPSVVTVKSIMPVSFIDDDVVVDVTVDSEGHLVDYAIKDCEHLAKSPTLRRAIERNLLYTEFLPATYFGRTVRAKMRISFLNSRIDVKG